MNTLPRWNTMPGGSSNVLVRAETLMATGGWDSELINLADWDLWARLARHGPPACVDRPARRISHPSGKCLRRYEPHIARGSPHGRSVRSETRLCRVAPLPGMGASEKWASKAQRWPTWSRRPFEGTWLDVARTLSTLARARIGKMVTALLPQPSRLHRAWIAEAEAWISRLRDAWSRSAESRAG